MAPMMQPLPRPINPKKAQERAEAQALEAAAAKQRSTMIRLILASTLAGGSLGLVVWLGMKTGPVAVRVPPAAPVTFEKVLEDRGDWFQAAQEGKAGERLKGILNENPGLKPGYRIVKTGRIAMKLRTLEGTWGPIPADEGKAPPPPPKESGGMSGGSPMAGPPPPPLDEATE
jgi:hypothetical protein